MTGEIVRYGEHPCGERAGAGGYTVKPVKEMVVGLGWASMWRGKGFKSRGRNWREQGTVKDDREQRSCRNDMAGQGLISKWVAQRNFTGDVFAL